MSSTMSANEQGGSGPTSDEFAAQTLCTTLSNLPFLSGTERALLGCIEKMITELSVIRGELDRKEKINMDLMKEYESQQVELQWYHTELDKKDEELEGKERELKELREKLTAKVQHGNDFGNCEANGVGGPARKKVKQEPLNSSQQELLGNQEMPTTSNSMGMPASTKERHVLPAKRRRLSHSADMADDSSSDDSKSSPNGSPPLNVAKPHKSAQKQIQEPPTVPTPSAPQLADYLPALLQNINVILSKHPAIASSPSKQQSKAKKKRANAKKGQQQQAKPSQKKKDSPPEANPNDGQQNVQQQESTAKKKKIYKVISRLERIKPRAQSTKVTLPTDQGQCYKMLNTHKTKKTPLYQWAQETVDRELTQAGLDLNYMLVSKYTKHMLNRMMLTAMTKADPEGFMAEL